MLSSFGVLSRRLVRERGRMRECTHYSARSNPRNVLDALAVTEEGSSHYERVLRETRSELHEGRVKGVDVVSEEEPGSGLLSILLNSVSIHSPAQIDGPHIR